MSKFVQIIQPSGEIDCNKVALLHQEILSFVNREITIILIDFCDAIAISSESIDSLYNIYQCVKEYGGSLYFCALSPEVKKNFKGSNFGLDFAPLASRREFEEKILACQ